MKDEFLNYDPSAGMSIDTACSEAIELAREGEQPVRFDFNGISIIAREDSNPETLIKQYHTDSEKGMKSIRKPQSI